MKEIEIIEAFKDKFETSPELNIKAPGRINLIGEHTDYNMGFVLPAAVNKAIYFSLSSRTDNQVNLYAVDLNECHSFRINTLEKSDKSWANFLIGVMNELVSGGADITHGFNLAFGGDVPLGAGMSSSAAVESGMGYAMNELFDLNLDRLALAKVAQMAEHNFAGVRCGIMDMYASLFGKENKLIKLDCRALTHEYLDFEFENVAIVLFNTGVKHNLADTEYNKRREECEAGVAVLQSHYSGIESLRDVSLAQLEAHKNEMSGTVYKRCHFVISETDRMHRASEALKNADLAAFGEIMYETHDGLQNEYEVSCKELDFLVDITRENKAISGSRMMGGGFGGCTINLIHKEEVAESIESISQAYFSEFGRLPESYEVEITDGCSEMAILEKDKL